MMDSFWTIIREFMPLIKLTGAIVGAWSLIKSIVNRMTDPDINLAEVFNVVLWCNAALWAVPGLMKLLIKIAEFASSIMTTVADNIKF